MVSRSLAIPRSKCDQWQAEDASIDWPFPRKLRTTTNQGIRKKRLTSVVYTEVVLQVEERIANVFLENIVPSGAATT